MGAESRQRRQKDWQEEARNRKKKLVPPRNRLSVNKRLTGVDLAVQAPELDRRLLGPQAGPNPSPPHGSAKRCRNSTLKR